MPENQIFVRFTECKELGSGKNKENALAHRAWAYSGLVLRFPGSMVFSFLDIVMFRVGGFFSFCDVQLLGFSTSGVFSEVVPRYSASGNSASGIFNLWDVRLLRCSESGIFSLCDIQLQGYRGLVL